MKTKRTGATLIDNRSDSIFTVDEFGSAAAPLFGACKEYFGSVEAEEEEVEGDLQQADQAAGGSGGAKHRRLLSFLREVTKFIKVRKGTVSYSI